MRKMILKWLTIALLVTVITILHYKTVGGHTDLHMIYRELYFFPIILASIWFGLIFGIGTSVIISLLYLPHIFIFADVHGAAEVVGIQILVFIIIAAVLGILIEHQRRQQKKLAEAERLETLGRAASVVGDNINSSLFTLMGTEGYQHLLENDDAACWTRELQNLRELADILLAFRPMDMEKDNYYELDGKIKNLATRLANSGRIKGVQISFKYDSKPLTLKISEERFERFLKCLVENAVDASQRGQTVRVDIRRESENCLVSVTDQGPGIRPENVAKIFSPFFTTKPGGQGLTLAAARKSLRELGGDILVENVQGQGARFTLLIPCARTH